MRQVLWLMPFLLFAEAQVIPTPQSLERRPGAVTLPRSQAVAILTGENPDRQTEIAADLLARELRGHTVRRVQQKPKGEPAVVLWNAERLGRPPGAASETVLDPQQHFGQGYLLETREGEVMVAGATGIGVLYGAATLAQLLEPAPDGLRIAGVSIRDYPSFRNRAASDWLLRAELNRWAYDFGDGMRAYAERIQRKLDFCVRFKINMVMFDGFGWSTDRRPGYAALMRELNEYAGDRGIKLMFAGFGANFDPAKVEPQANIGRVILNRRTYPLGEVYRCFGEGRGEHPTYGTCRSNDALQREIARDFEEFVRAVEPGALYVHHEDTGKYETTQVRWAARCDECKRRWPNADFAAADGGAGAMARGYSNILEAVNRVRNADSGYDAKRDCTVVFISPPYGVDSQRSGMGSQKVDPVLNWHKTLEFWENVVAAMPRAANFEVGFREIFAGPGGRQWMDVYRERMAARGLNPNVFLFFLGGADQYSNGSFNYPVTGSAVMNGLYDGAQTIYNFNGGLHQEPQQVINAEYSWNSRAPGRLVPETFEEGLKRWHALMKNEEMPEEVFGPEGVFHAACARIYGSEAGAAMARFFSFHEERTAGDLPEFYPRKIYPVVVLWRFLQGDSVYQDPEMSEAEHRVLEAFGIGRPEFQRQLAQLWRQTEMVNRQGSKLLEAVFAAGDLRPDAREDVERLRLSLRVGGRMAGLLAAYHGWLAGEEDRDEPLRLTGSVSRWLREQARYDFTDPKGGDASSWLEAVEGLRSRLLAFNERALTGRAQR